MNFVEIKTSELVGTALDYAVCLCEKRNMLNIYGQVVRSYIPYYSSDWGCSRTNHRA